MSAPSRPVAALLPPLKNKTGTLVARLLPHGGLHRLDSGELTLNLFPGNALEAGPVNLLLRRRGPGGVVDAVPLLGPASPGRVLRRGRRIWVQGDWQGIAFVVELKLADAEPAWAWHVALTNGGEAPVTLDLLHVHDLGLAPFGAIRNNEFYVSQYIDNQPLDHAIHGRVVASRQNAAAGGRYPWGVTGSLARGVACATDALQLPASAWLSDLPDRRLQHEHSQVAIQDEAFELAPGTVTRRGFFGLFEADHPAASSTEDLAAVDRAVAAIGRRWRPPSAGDSTPIARSDNLFSTAPPLAVQEATETDLAAWFGTGPRREVERQGDQLLSFFLEDDCHVVLAAKEREVLRPHGQILRSGSHWTPDEAAVTTTVWMAGVFGSALAQGHVSINAILSTQRSYLGLFQAMGQRVFVDAGEGWRLLHSPSAVAFSPRGARWFYRMAQGTLVVDTEAHASEPEVALRIEVIDGPPVKLLVTNHVALNGGDGLDAVPLRFKAGSGQVVVRPAARSAMADRFPQGRVVVRGGWASAEDDRALFADGRSRALPYLCLRFDDTRAAEVTWRCELVEPTAPAKDEDFLRQSSGALHMKSTDPAVARLQAIAPWLVQNALVHYLAPRGLEQFSGGGWGTRDVSQGPTEWLLALGRHAPLRDLLLRVFANQNVDGDWPQWFMFFPRDAHIRAGDSHGDVVFWPLVALAQYLRASGDASILGEPASFHSAEGDTSPAPIAEHVERALALIRTRMVAGTQLVAYGHGDWNDALQPADPALRDKLCSAWTVTLHVRMLTLLAEAWQHLGREADAKPLLQWREQVIADFQRVLVADDELAGMALFDPGRPPELLLHPSDERTGLRHSALAMVHAITDDLFTPEQAAQHLALIREHLWGPDGLRIFDRPLTYEGGLQRLFQRGESASYFGREIGLMYMHLHLRFAEALAHLGRADELFEALQLANPIGIRSLVKTAARRQANCYYSSSDAAFADRVEASAHYDRIGRGEVALEGGWRVYSSGAGIAFRLIVQCLLGLAQQHDRLVIDPVLPRSLDGLRASLLLYGREVEVAYRVGERGHGPLRVLADGQPLEATPLANRYRAPGVAVAAQALRAVQVLSIEIG